jgi:hypothetical protein
MNAPTKEKQPLKAPWCLKFGDDPLISIEPHSLSFSLTGNESTQGPSIENVFRDAIYDAICTAFGKSSITNLKFIKREYVLAFNRRIEQLEEEQK